MAESRYLIGVDLETTNVIAGLDKIQAAALRSVEALKASVTAGLPSFITPEASTFAATAATDTTALIAGAGGNVGLDAAAALSAHNLSLDTKFTQVQDAIGQSGVGYAEALAAARGQFTTVSTEQTELLATENKVIAKSIADRQARLEAQVQYGEWTGTAEGEAALQAAAEAKYAVKLRTMDANNAAMADETAFSQSSAALAEQKRLALAQSVEALRIQLGYNADAAVIDGSFIELKTQYALLSQELNAQVKLAIAEQKAQNDTGEASLFQKLVAYSKGGGAIASEQQTGSQFAAAGLARTARLAGTFAGFAALAGIVEIAKYSSDLEKNLNKVNEQLNAMGQGGQLAKVKSSILDVSGSTGVATKDLVPLEQEFLGLYQNVSLANDATDAAAKIIRTTGLSASEAGPLLAAAAKDFNVSVEQLGDAALTVQDKTGRSAKDVIDFFGQIAPVAQQYGISLKEVRGLAESIGVSSGKNFQQIAEGLNRELPQLQSAIPKLLQVPGLNLSNKALGGDPLQILKDILAQYDKLAPASQRAIIALGGPRQAQILATLFDNPTKALAALNDQTENNGRLNKENKSVQESLSGTLKRTEQAFLQAGEAAFNGGLGAALNDLLKVFEALGNFLKTIIGGFKSFNDALGGIPGRILEIVGVLILLNKVQEIKFISTLLEYIPIVITKIGALITSLRTLELTEVGANVGGAVSGGLGALGGKIGLGKATSTLGADGLATTGAEGLGSFGLVEGTGLGLAASTGVGLIAIAAGLTMAKLADDVKKSNQAKISKIQDELQNKSNEEIAKSLKTASDKPIESPGGYSGPLDVSNLPGVGKYLGKAEDFFGGNSNKTTKRDLVLQEIRKRRAQQEGDIFNQLKQAGVINDDQWKKIEDDLNDPGNEGKYNDLQKLLIDITGSGKGKDAFNAIAKANATKKAENDAAAGLKDNTGAQLETVSDLTQSYNDGNITLQQYLDGLNKLKDGYQRAIDAGNVDPALLKDVNEAKKAITDAITKQAKSDEQFAILAEGLSGDNPATQALKNQATALQLASNPNVDVATREGAANDVLKYQQTALTQLIKTATSTQDILDLINKPQAIDPAAQAAFAAAHPGQPVPTQQFASQEQKDAAAQRIKQINDSYRNLANSLTNDKLLQSQNDQSEALKELDAAAAAYGKGSPEYRDALAAYNKAGTAIQDVLQQRANEAESLREAIDARDPVKLAQDKIDKAVADLNTARALGDPDKITAAQTALVSAQQAYADSMSAILTAQAGLAAAVADAAGNTAEGLRIKVADLKRQLDLLASEGLSGSAQYINLQADIVNQQHALDTQLRTDSKDYYEFLYNTKQITKEQLITYLTGLLQGVTKNTQEYYSLQQEIFNLKNQVGNLAFNVPTIFDLPTLYEVRRLNSASQAGQGYNDNRQQVVNVYVGNGMSASQVTQAVQGALNTGSGRYGVA